MSYTGKLKAGDQAPAIELPDADMSIVRLGDYLGDPMVNFVVLYFYVRDDTPGCTAQAIEFSDLEPDFARQRVVVLGVSRDDCISHGIFRDKHGITVRLLADKEGVACRDYGVLAMREVDGVQREGVVRSTFIIDKQGVLRQVIYGAQAKGHAQEILQYFNSLSATC